MLHLIRVFRKTKHGLQELYRLRDQRAYLDFLLANAHSVRDFDDCSEWFLALWSWLRASKEIQTGGKIDKARLPSVRLKYLLYLIDKNSEWREHFVRIIYTLIIESEAVEFFSEVGLNNQVGFFQELSERVVERILPDAPLESDLRTLWDSVCRSESDISWFINIDEDVLAQLVNLLQAHDYQHLKDDIEDAVIFLISQVRAFAFTPQFRTRSAYKHLRESPFFELQNLFSALSENLSQDDAQNEIQLNIFLGKLDHCAQAIDEVYNYLDDFGVSVSLVFQLERSRRQLERIHLLAQMLMPRNQISVFKMLLIQISEHLLSRRKIRSFLAETFNLLTKKVVERNSEIGEHYIVRDRLEFKSMFKSASGGGIITGLTVFIKFWITSWYLPLFMTGCLASVNYAISFLAIQFSGFTLATKQPAAAAPFLARKLKDLKTSEIESVADDVISVVRSQVVAVAGNLLLVIPSVLIFYQIYFNISGKPFLAPEKAWAVVTSTDILGPTIVYAAFTGVVLFSTSVIAGWFDNWFTYRSVDKKIAKNKRLRIVAGEKWPERVGTWLKKNMAALTGNISLGLALGLLPEIFKFLGIPLDVRHVTLSTGSLAAAISSLGWDYIRHPMFFRAVTGILLIGFLNILVCFVLAMLFAITAQNVPSRHRTAIYQAVLGKLAKKPWTLLVPGK